MTDTSVDDFLAHHGIKGMKWGKHKAESSSSTSSAPTHREKKQALNKAADDTLAKTHGAAKGKFTSAQIKEARARQGERGDKIEKHVLDQLNATTDKGRANAQRLLNKAMDDYANNPDAGVSVRMTGAEKATTILAGVGLAASAALLVIR